MRPRNISVKRPNRTKNTPLEPGDRFSMLKLVIKLDVQTDKTNKWLCECECGKLAIAWESALRDKETRSCGCRQWTDAVDRIGQATGNPNPLEKDVATYMKKHHRRIYRLWCGVRCQKTTHAKWKSLRKFFDDVGDPGSYFVQLCRYDTSKKLGPSNFYWGDPGRSRVG